MASAAVAPVSAEGQASASGAPTSKYSGVHIWPEAEWTPDANAPQCELCEFKWTLTKRRHHCRGCGKCVCDNCGNKWWVFWDRKTGRKPQRVCEPCQNKLKEQFPDEPVPENGDSAASQKAKKEGGKKVLAKVAWRFSPSISRKISAPTYNCSEIDNDLPHNQDYYFCLTCDANKQVNVCLKCWETCHATHDYHPVKQFGEVSCHCWKVAKFNKEFQCLCSEPLDEEKWEVVRKTGQAARANKINEDAEKRRIEAQERAQKMREEAELRVKEAHERAEKLRQEAYDRADAARKEILEAQQRQTETLAAAMAAQKQ